LMRVLDGVPLQAFILSLIALDVGLTIHQIVGDIAARGGATDDEEDWVFNITIFVVVTLLAEVCLRIFGLGVRPFFSNWLNTLDLFISVISFVLELVVFAAYQRDSIAHSAMNMTAISGGDAAAASNFSALRVLRPLTRIFRVCRVGTRAFRQQHLMKTTARHVVGGNKRRFQEDGFDLDLAYVTDTLIGMSVPAVGKTSLYRNPIDEVARFFRARHPNGYMIYNCTTECA